MLLHTSKIILIAVALISCQSAGAQDVGYPAPAVGNYDTGCNCGQQQGDTYNNCGRGISQQQAMDAWSNYCNEQCGFNGRRPERCGGLFGRCGCGRGCNGGGFGYPSNGCQSGGCGQRGCQFGSKLNGLFHHQNCGGDCNACGQSAGACGCGGKLKGLFQHRGCGGSCDSCGDTTGACGCGFGGKLKGMFHRQDCGTSCDTCGDDAANCGCGGKLKGLFANCNLFNGCGNGCGCGSKCRLFSRFGGYNQDSCCVQSCVAGCGSMATEVPVAQPVAE